MAADGIDLQVSLTDVTTQGDPGSPYNATIILNNNSPISADGSTFTFDYPSSLSNVQITCIEATTGATCDASSFNLRKASPRSGYRQATGSFASLPANAVIKLSITATLPVGSTPTSFSSYAGIEPPIGVTDIDTASNTTSQVTGINQVSTSVTVKKTVDNPVIESQSGTFTYTITYENTGDHPALMSIVDDVRVYPGDSFSYNGQTYPIKDLNSGYQVNWSYRIANCTLTGGTCPDWLTTGATLSNTGTQTTIYGGRTGFYSPAGNTGRFTLPAKSKLTLTIPLTVNITGCVTEDGYALIRNSAQYTSLYPDGNPQITPSSGSSYADAVMRVQKCTVPETYVNTSKAVDNPVIESNRGTFTYTVVYENTGDYAAPINIRDEIQVRKIDSELNYNGTRYQTGVLSRGSTVNWSYRIAGCTLTTGVCPDWLTTGQTMGSSNSSTYVLGTSTGFIDPTTQDGRVILPAKSKLTLTIPVSVNITGCVLEKDYVLIQNDAEFVSRDPYATRIRINPTASGKRVDAVMRVGRCATPETTVTVSKSLENPVIEANNGTFNYTVKYENIGDYSATVNIKDEISFSKLGGTFQHNGTTYTAGYLRSGGQVRWSYRIAECVYSGGACPDWLTPGRSLSSTNNPAPVFGADGGFMWAIGAEGRLILPAGSSITLKIPVTVSVNGCIADANDYLLIKNIADYRQRDPLSSRVRLIPEYGSSSVESVIKPGRCFDAYTQTSIQTRTSDTITNPDPGQAIQVVSRIANSFGTATNIPFTQSLPAKGILTPDEAVRAGFATSTADALRVVCRKGSGTNPPTVVACPAGVAYDPVTHTVKGTIPGPLAAGEYFQVVTLAYAGIIPPKTATYPFYTELGAMSGDMNPVNESKRGFGLTNTQTTVTTAHTLNIPAPENIVLTGQLVCELQGDATANPAGLVKNFTVTLAKGQTSVNPNLVTDALWKGDNCTITMTRPQAPAGYMWIDRPQWDTAHVQSASLIQQPWHTIYPMQLGRPPVPPDLPFTGGVAAQLFTFGGFGAFIVAVAVIWYRRRQTA